MDRRELQRSMYELRNASMHQWFALVGVAGVGVALAWWMLAEASAEWRNSVRLARIPRHNVKTGTYTCGPEP